MKLGIFAVLVAAVLALPLPADAQPVCATGFPSTESPVVSNSPDDIPPTAIDIVTWSGAYAKARANHNIAFVELSANEQRVYFGVDANPSLGRVFYNRRLRDPATGQWTWRYASSPEVIRFSTPASGLAGAVLYSADAKYRDPASGTRYKFVMYQIVQPGACDGQVAGFVYYSLSNDGICWTTPRAAKRPGGPSFNCSTAVTESVPVEAVSAIDAGDRIYLVGLEGDITNQLAPPVTVLDPDGQPRRYNNMNKTLTALGSATYDDPGTVTILGMLTANGMMIAQHGPANQSNLERYRTHAYFIDLDIAWDAANGDFYIGRAYPYPFDRGSLIPIGRNDPPEANNTPLRSQLQQTVLMGPHGPSPVIGCHDSPATLPNRVQIYRMRIGSLANISQITTGTWSLVTDVGGSAGYSFDKWYQNGQTATPLLSWMTNINLDLGAVSFLKNGRGELVRYGQTAYSFLGEVYKRKKAIGPCRINGNEREFLRAIP